jgi:hypothetical protein
MKLQLILKDDSPMCQQTKRTWTEACDEFGLEIEVFFLDTPPGKILSEQLKVTTFPALFADGIPAAVGIPEPPTARHIISELLDKSSSMT